MEEDNWNEASSGVVLAFPIKIACPNPPDNGSVEHVQIHLIMGVLEKSGAQKNQSVELLEIIEEICENGKM